MNRGPRRDYFFAPRQPRGRTRAGYECSVRTCGCCQRLVVVVYNQERGHFVTVILAENGRLVWDGNPVYDRKLHRIHLIPSMRFRPAKKPTLLQKTLASIAPAQEPHDEG